jgi:hypothetical protein
VPPHHAATVLVRDSSVVRSESRFKGRGATTVPTRGTARTQPSALSIDSACAAVAKATFHFLAKARVEGTRAPGAR